MGTKNNPKNRKAVAKKQYNGKDIEPILYQGTHAGHGKYMAAKYAGTAQVIVDTAGKPMQWEELV